MPTRSLPDNPSLEHLRNQARSLQQRVRSGDQDALAQVREFDPRTEADRTPHGEFSLTTAQLVVARSYGFAGWQRLRDYVDVIREYSRWPEPATDLPNGQDDDLGTAADRFLSLACLTYTRDGQQNQRRAQDLLAARPDLATASIHTMAAVGEVDALRRLLAEDPSRAGRRGGPFDWEPLLYLTYSRIGTTAPGRSAPDVARLLLDAGADPDAGFLWQGFASPFTALTGAFGGGERSQPPHPDSLAVARLVLEAGADPNDNQALYNRMFGPANDHLELLFEFGLGTDVDGPWRRRLVHTYPSPRQMLEEQLRWAADHGFVDRVRLLLRHGVDPDGTGYHPSYGDRTAYQWAVAAGNREVVQVLVDAGATAVDVDPVQEFLSACLAGDRDEAERLRAADPALVAGAVARQPEAVVRAAVTGRMEAVRLLLDLGFDIDAGGATALHEAALTGDLPMVQLLLDRGADPRRRDPHHDSTPLGWAGYGAERPAHHRERAQHAEVIALLDRLTQP